MGAQVLGGWEPFAELASDGVPEFSYHGVPPRLRLATRRQLRTLGLSIGAQEPVARVVWGRRPGRPARDGGARVRYGDLYRVDLARKRRAHTPAQEQARLRAMTARMTCDVEGHEGDRVMPYCIARTSLGGCLDCWQAGRCAGSAGPPPPPVDDDGVDLAVAVWGDEPLEEAPRAA